jgi:hypothetical protein
MQTAVFNTICKVGIAEATSSQVKWIPTLHLRHLSILKWYMYIFQSAPAA